MNTYLARIVLIVVAAFLGSGVWTNAQEVTRKLFESGQYQAVVEQTQNDAPPEAQYVKGLAHLKLNQTDQAKAAFRGLEGAGDAWRSVGQSAVALIDGNRDAALEAARAAAARDAGLAPAHAFARAAAANPQMAYAHYNAGMSFYKAKRVDRMAVYFENFLKLAPNAPERPAVESIMRTLRGK